MSPIFRKRHRKSLSDCLLVSPVITFGLMFSLLILLGVPSQALAQLSESEMTPLNRLNPIQFGRPDMDPIKLKRKAKPTMADIFPHRDLGGAPIQPIFLGNIKIPGLSPAAMHSLGMNYYCVVNNTSYESFSDAYRWNRLNGKANFVTADSLMHPYFAFKNGILGSVIEDHLYSDLYHLLNATIEATIEDYKQAEDSEVKDDLQRNLAYLTVGLRLLDPNGKLPDIGGADKLAEVDYKSCRRGIRAKSVIFNQNVDFSYCTPWGWYANSDKVSRFYQSYQWLSKVYFPFRNVTVNTLSGGGNSFRRAVLLYRSLTLAKVGQSQAILLWNRVGNGFALCGMDAYYRIHTILPPDLSSVLDRSRGSFTRLLDIVSQPYARTKLMLKIRKQRPVQLGSTSIFEIGSGGKAPEDLEVFRFFPLIQPSESNWLRHVGHEFKTETDEPTPTPLSLLTLHGHGAARATNLLSLQMESLDSRLLTAVPRLERIISIAKGGKEQSEADRRWSVITQLFHPYPDEVQVALRTNHWYSRQLESAMGAWVDSYTAYNPISKAKTSGAGKKGAVLKESTRGSGAATGKASGSNSAAAGQNAAPQRLSRFHYLDPRPMIYHLMARDLEDLEKSLVDLAIFPARYKKRLEDFKRLYARMESIAKREIAGEPIMKQDFSLLANIDLLLDQVDSPLPASIYFNIGQAYGTQRKEGEGEGATIGIGRAGRLYVVCNTTQGATLGRGAVYTLYELAGGPYPLKHWNRKLEFDLVRPPIWARPYDFMQSKTPTKTE